MPYIFGEADKNRIARTVRDVESGRFNDESAQRTPPNRPPVETWIAYTTSNIGGLVTQGDIVLPGYGTAQLWACSSSSSGGAGTGYPYLKNQGIDVTIFNLYSSIPSGTLVLLNRDPISGNYFCTCPCATGNSSSYQVSICASGGGTTYLHIPASTGITVDSSSSSYGMAAAFDNCCCTCNCNGHEIPSTLFATLSDLGNASCMQSQVVSLVCNADPAGWFGSIDSGNGDGSKLWVSMTCEESAAFVWLDAADPRLPPNQFGGCGSSAGFPDSYSPFDLPVLSIGNSCGICGGAPGSTIGVAISTTMGMMMLPPAPHMEMQSSSSSRGSGFSTTATKPGATGGCGCQK